MLVFLSLAQQWGSQPPAEQTDQEKELHIAKTVLNDVEKVVHEYRDSFPVPDKPVTLASADETEHAASRISPDDRLSRLPQDLRALLGRAARAVEEVQNRADQAERRAESAEIARNEAEAAAQSAGRDLDILREKGHNPPCWYETVSLAGGGDRERPFYTFEVAVFDDSMIFRQVPAPPGGATDDEHSIHSSYADESRALELDHLPYSTALSDAEVMSAIRPIHAAGKEAKIRTYSCIFWARVWDLTSSDAKERWKSAHDGVLESLLGTYTVGQDPWE